MKILEKQKIKELIEIENPMILDIGCYDGKDAKDLANLFENCEIHCFDPDPRAFELFDHFNKDNEQLTFYPFAVCHHNQNEYFYLSDSATRRHYDFQKEWSASSSIKKPKEHLNVFPDVTFKQEPIVVSCIRLDTWVALYDHKNKIIDLIWADVNGSEKELIEGANQTLCNTRFLYIEFSNKELYEGEITKQELLNKLYDFEVVGTYNEGENFGNLLLKNKLL